MWLKVQKKALLLLMVGLFASTAWALPPRETKAVQTRLAELGHYSGAIDGQYRESTRTAVQRFQRQQGLTATGWMDAQTSARLGWWDVMMNQALEGRAGSVAPATAAPTINLPAERLRENRAGSLAETGDSSATAADVAAAEQAGAARSSSKPAPTTTSQPQDGSGGFITQGDWENGSRGFGKNDYGWVIQGGVYFGGDDAVDVDFTDGDNRDVTAGEGYAIAGGGYYQFSGLWSIKALLGYKLAAIFADNGDITVDRLTADVIARYNWREHHRVGAGLTYHFNIDLDIDVDNGESSTFEADPALGVTLEYQWRFVGLSYTNIEYDVEGGDELDASNFGLFFIGEF